MRQPMQLYDEIGIPLAVGDMIRVYHFRTVGKKYWMYKRVAKQDGFFIAEHYPFGERGWYGLQTNGQHLKGVRIVASRDCDFEVRKKVRPLKAEIEK